MSRLINIKKIDISDHACVTMYYQILEAATKMLGSDVHPESIKTFAVNIYLVLKGIRLAYRCDVYMRSNVNTEILPINTKLANLAVELTSSVLRYIPGEEPIIYLRANRDKIIAMSKSYSGVELLGMVLGYQYVAVDWPIGKAI